MKSIIYLFIICLFIQFFTWAHFLSVLILFYIKIERRNGILPNEYPSSRQQMKTFRLWQPYHRMYMFQLQVH